MLYFTSFILRAFHLHVGILIVDSAHASFANPIEHGTHDFVKRAARDGFQISNTFRANSTPSGRNDSVNSNLGGNTHLYSFGRGKDGGRAYGFDSVNFAFSLGRDIKAILEKLDKVMANSMGGYLALKTRVESLENLLKGDYVKKSENISEELRNLRLTVTNRLALLQNGADIAARTSMKCLLKKRDKPVPVGTMKAGDELYAEEQFCSTDNQTCLYLQSNGNMVLYRTMTLQVIWTSYTGVGDCRSLLRMQYDGRLALYHFPTKEAKGATALAHGAKLVFRTNLCLKLYDDSDCFWSTDFIDSAWDSQIYYQK
ncbi:uncharacterized protein LOC129599970 [Paramacrobiotus metropolitanus]|uniref:uncharacterized protein LOC129599970 n=1 Tax=Paramacrobiotus metropolitanus TaxID=2943436 RepID=UPI002445C51C|nr:uncharacterized protein LOC129599970 [Paramacrobiotus metropolitanus]